MSRTLSATVDVRRDGDDESPYADIRRSAAGLTARRAATPTARNTFVNLEDPLPDTLRDAEAELGRLDGDIVAIQTQLEQHRGSTKDGHEDWERRARFSLRIKEERRRRVQGRYDDLRAGVQSDRRQTFEHAFVEAAKRVLSTAEYASVVAEVIRTVPHLIP